MSSMSVLRWTDGRYKIEVDMPFAGRMMEPGGEAHAEHVQAGPAAQPARDGVHLSEAMLRNRSPMQHTEPSMDRVCTIRSDDALSESDVESDAERNKTTRVSPTHNGRSSAGNGPSSKKGKGKALLTDSSDHMLDASFTDMRQRSTSFATQGDPREYRVRIPKEHSTSTHIGAGMPSAAGEASKSAHGGLAVSQDTNNKDAVTSRIPLQPPTPHRRRNKIFKLFRRKSNDEDPSKRVTSVVRRGSASVGVLLQAAANIVTLINNGNPGTGT